MGAPVEGAVYVFEKGDSGIWTQTARLSGFGMNLGAAVAVKGNQLVAAASGDGTEGKPWFCTCVGHVRMTVHGQCRAI